MPTVRHVSETTTDFREQFIFELSRPDAVCNLGEDRYEGLLAQQAAVGGGSISATREYLATA